MTDPKFASMAAFEYSVFAFNEIATSYEDKNAPFEIVWDTSLGLAKARLVNYLQDDFPIIEEKIGVSDLSYEVFRPELENYDLFSVVRHNVYGYFKQNMFFSNVFLSKRPDILLEKLLELSKVEVTDDLIIPNYSTIWDFKTLDGSVDLPFIRNVQINKPVSLISKS